MRIYIIGNDGITLCREAPATVNDGEIAVASKEELHAAPLTRLRGLGPFCVAHPLEIKGLAGKVFTTAGVGWLGRLQ